MHCVVRFDCRQAASPSSFICLKCSKGSGVVASQSSVHRWLRQEPALSETLCQETKRVNKKGRRAPHVLTVGVKYPELGLSPQSLRCSLALVVHSLVGPESGCDCSPGDAPQQAAPEAQGRNTHVPQGRPVTQQGRIWGMCQACH